MSKISTGDFKREANEVGEKLGKHNVLEAK